MPLEKGQENLILGMIDSFLDLPTDAKELSTEIANIHHAFSSNEAKPDNPYQFIQRPTEHLYGLEKHSKNASVTIGDVKMHLLKLFDDKISAATQSLGKDIKIQWDKKQLQKKIMENKDFKENFVSKPREPEHPYGIPKDPDQIFDAWLITKPDEKKIEIQLKVTLSPNQVISKTITYLEANDFKDDHHFLLDVISNPFTRATAEKACVEIILDFFIHCKLITLSERKNYFSNPTLTYQTYFNLVKEHKISLFEILNISIERFLVLSQEPIRKLIMSGKSSIELAKNLKANELEMISPITQRLLEKKSYTIRFLTGTPGLNTYQKQMLSHPDYYQVIEDGLLKLDEVKNFSIRECKNFCWPATINLLNLKKITLNQIKNMSSGTRLVISDPFYADKIKRGQISYDAVEYLNILNGNILTLPEIKSLVEKNNPLISDITKLSMHAKSLIIENAMIRYFLQHEILSIHDIKNIFNDSILDESEKNWVKKLEEHEKNKLKLLVKEFIVYAISGLLFESDLHYLYHNMAEIKFDTEKFDTEKFDKKDYKHNPLTRVSLLTHQPILLRCKNNIKLRLQSVASNSPILLDMECDSLEKIKSDCKKCDIDYVPIQHDILNLEIKQYTYPPTTLDILSNLIQLGKQIGLSQTEVFKHIFGLRLSALFNRTPYLVNKTETDNVKTLLFHMHLISRDWSIPVNTLQGLSSQYVLLEIKNQLQQHFHDKKVHMPRIYSDILNIISHTESKSLKANQTKKADFWLSCLAEVSAHKRQTYCKIPPLTFFTSTHSPESIDGIKEFRDKLNVLEEFFPSNTMSYTILL